MKTEVLFPFLLLSFGLIGVMSALAKEPSKISYFSGRYPVLKFSSSLLIPTALLMAACSISIPGSGFADLTGSSELVTQTYDFSDFTGVNASNAFQVEIVQGDHYMVEVTVDDNIAEYLQVEMKDDIVFLGLAPSISMNRTTQKARITLPVLTSLHAFGAVTANLYGFRSVQDLKVEVAGASRVQGDIEAGDVQVKVSGSSTLRLKGSGRSADITAVGASTADLSAFPVTNARANAAGASRINLDVSGVLNADASGASSVRYTGTPKIERSDMSGASTISGAKTERQ
jgi:hypothetical protein